MESKIRTRTFWSLMDGPTIGESILDLEIIRQTLCSYSAKHNERCDCKFGVKHIYPESKIKFMPRLPKGERGCGCAELRYMINRLKTIKNLYEDHKKSCGWCSTSCNSMEDVVSISGRCGEGDLLRKIIW